MATAKAYVAASHSLDYQEFGGIAVAAWWGMRWTERIPNRHRPDRGTAACRELRAIRRPLFALLLVALVGTTPATLACSSIRGRGNLGVAPNSQEQLAPDSTVVIIRVANAQPFDVAVFLDTPFGLRLIGHVGSKHESIFILPTTTVAAITEFAVAVIPGRPVTSAYRTGVITRTPGRMTFVGIVVGSNPESGGATRSGTHT